VTLAGAGLLAIVLGVATVRLARADLIEAYAEHPQFNLLERVTRYDTNSHEAIEFLQQNELEVNLLIEWAQSGLVMFRAPQAKVLVDGRAQQLYSEAHFRRYMRLLIATNTPPGRLLRMLDRDDTDAVLLRRTAETSNLRLTLEQSPRWIPALLDARDVLYLRRDGPGLAQLGRRMRRGAEWRPDTPLALASRGFVWQALDPPDLQQAVASWRAAVQRDVSLGKLCFRPMTAGLLALGREEDALRIIESYEQRLSQPPAAPVDFSRRELLDLLQMCRRDIDGRKSNAATDRAEE
jgi:hypothetical protein